MFVNVLKLSQFDKNLIGIRVLICPWNEEAKRLSQDF